MHMHISNEDLLALRAVGNMTAVGDTDKNQQLFARTLLAIIKTLDEECEYQAEQREREG